MEEEREDREGGKRRRKMKGGEGIERREGEYCQTREVDIDPPRLKDRHFCIVPACDCQKITPIFRDFHKEGKKKKD